MSFLLGQSVDTLAKILSLSLFSKGTTTYFSKNCTEQDSKLVKEFMELNVIYFNLIFLDLKLEIIKHFYLNLLINRKSMLTIAVSSKWPIIRSK